MPSEEDQKDKREQDLPQGQELTRALQMLAGLAHGVSSPDVRKDAMRLAPIALAILPEQDRRVLLNRLGLLGPRDFHSLSRWFKDLVWLAATERLRRCAGLVDTPALVQQLEHAGAITSEQSQALTARVTEELASVKARFAEGKAILCYGKEVRFDPVERQVIIGAGPPLEQHQTEPLIISAPPRILLSVLVYNGWDDTKQLLTSLDAIKTPNVELVILDNGSQQNRLAELAEITRTHPYRLTLMHSPTNLGYGEGHNVVLDYGLDQTRADHLIFLNNDVVVDPKVVDVLVAFSEIGWREGRLRPEQIGAVGPIAYALDGDRPTRSIQLYGARFPRPWHLGRSGVVPPNRVTADVLAEVMPVDYVAGPALALSARVLRRVGGFDPRFFGWGEERDLGMRLKEAGYASLVTKQAVLWHKGAGSSGGAAFLPVRTRTIIRNRFLHLRKHAAFWRPMTLLGVAVEMCRLGTSSLRNALRHRRLDIALGYVEGLMLGLLGRFDDVQAGPLEQVQSLAPSAQERRGHGHDGTAVV